MFHNNIMLQVNLQLLHLQKQSAHHYC